MSVIALLSGGRATLGGGAWIAPRLAARVFGADVRASPQIAFVVRLFAARDLALALGLLLSKGRSRRLWLQMGIFCDAADAVAGVLAGGDGQVGKLPALAMTGAALTGVGLGVAGLQEAE